jgi:hypothetical protein
MISQGSAGRSDSSGPQKGERTVPIPAPVLNALRGWKLKAPESKFDLLLQPQGQYREPGQHHHRGLIPIEIKAGVAVPVPNEDRAPVLDKKGKPIMAAKYTGLHAFRHFFASWCINRRADGGLELAQGRPGTAWALANWHGDGCLRPPLSTERRRPGWPRRRRPCSLRHERDMGMIFPTISMDGHR